MKTATRKKPAPKAIATSAQLTPPKLGQVWPGQGGVFVGTVRGVKGAPDYHLIVGPKHEKELNWKKADPWAKEQNVDGHKDFSLPDRREQHFLFCQGEGLFQQTWYWSSEQPASSADYAWAQLFDHGYQGYWHKVSLCRARAVRRLVI